MTDDNKEDTSTPSSNPYFARSGFPFVFFPSTFASGFNTKNEPSPKIESKEIQNEETVDEDKTDEDNEKNDLRISQPKYSQLLKELDFSQTRMVDVTNLLSNEFDDQVEEISSEENQNSKKTTESTSNDDDEQIRDEKDLERAEKEIQNDLNNLAAIIQAAAQISTSQNDDNENHQVQKKPTFDEDDDTSKQATQNYDLLDNEQEEVVVPSTKSSKIPRLINQQSNSNRKDTKSIVSNVNLEKENDNQMTQQEESFDWDKLVHGNEQISPPKVEEIKDSSDEQDKRQPPQSSVFKTTYSTSSSSSSSSSDTESIVQQNLSPPKQEQQQVPIVLNPSQANRQDSQETLIDENLDDFSTQLKQALIEQERQAYQQETKDEQTTDGFASASFPLSTDNVLQNDLPKRTTEDLLHRASNQRQRYSTEYAEHSNLPRKRTHRRHSTSRNSRKPDDNWLSLLEKLEREHRERLEKQQQQYENYMHTLEEKMKQRFDDYLTLTNGFQESRLDDYDNNPRLNHRTHTSIPIDSNIGRYKTHTKTHQYRPLADDIISRYYPADSTLNVLSTDRKSRRSTTNLSKSNSNDDVLDLQTDPSTKHAKQIADLKFKYECEINELKSQVNRLRMGNTSNSARQSMETIERINNENIRLHDEVNDLRHSLKLTEDDNKLLKNQLEELREQLNTKDLDLKTYHRTISDLEQQLTEAENTKERQDEKSRHADRQVLFYRDENENLKTDLNFTRERLLRLEERYQEQEAENEKLRRQLLLQENDSNRLHKSRLTDDHKLSTTTAARDYGRYTLSPTKVSSSPRDTNIHYSRYQSTNTNDNYLRHEHSPRPMTRITDYLNDKPTFPQPYVSPIRNVFSPRKSSPTRRRNETVSTRNSIDRQSKQIEQLEQKFDQLLKKKRDLETRLSRIPLRGLTTTDRQLSDVLEREIDRVQQQLSSVKLELRKLNVFRS